MKRVPVLPTILVLLAVAAMIALGLWQLQRRDEKLALLARYGANQHLAPIALPRFPDESVLFRRAGAMCLQPVAWHSEAGRAADGSSGWRLIADCRTGAEGPGFAVQVGIASKPGVQPAWKGGRVSGYITHAPQHRALIQSAWSRTAQPLMLVADTPLPGLKPNAAANLDDIPNNHLAYAVQWFIFAGLAVVIYAIALRQRVRKQTAERDPN
jgi:surfeit locus 1 family protein